MKTNKKYDAYGKVVATPEKKSGSWENLLAAFFVFFVIIGFITTMFYVGPYIWRVVSWPYHVNQALEKVEGACTYGGHYWRWNTLDSTSTQMVARETGDYIDCSDRRIDIPSK